VGDDRGMDVIGKQEKRKASFHTKVGSEHCIWRISGASVAQIKRNKESLDLSLRAEILSTFPISS
jgi:hypothetical protein